MAAALLEIDNRVSVCPEPSLVPGFESKHE
jgi:hypothetical protein